MKYGDEVMPKVLISQYKLSVRAQNNLCRHGIFDMDALNTIFLEEIATWKNIGAKTLAEIKELKEGFGTLKAFDKQVVPRNSVNSDAPDDLKDLGNLVNRHRCILDKHTIGEIPLAVSTYNVLSRARIVTLLDLAFLIRGNFLGEYRLGTESKAEIIEQFNNWIHNNLNSNTEIAADSVATPDTETISVVEEIQSTSLQTVPTIDDSSDKQAERHPQISLIESRKEELGEHTIKELSLSVRSYNGLSKARAVTLLSLAELIDNDFSGTHQLGVKSKSEIVKKFNNWVHDNLSIDVDIQDALIIGSKNGTDSSVAKAQSPDLKKVSTIYENVDGSAEKQDLRRFIELHKEKLSEHTIKELPLSVRSYNALSRAMALTLLNLAELICNGFSGTHQIGAKSRKEIITAFDSWVHDNIKYFEEIPADLDEDTDEAKYFNLLGKKMSKFIDYGTTYFFECCSRSGLYERISSDGYDTITMENYRAALDVPELQENIKKAFKEIAPSGMVPVDDFESEVKKCGIEVPPIVLADKYLDDGICIEKDGFYFYKRPYFIPYLQEMAFLTKDKKYTMLSEKVEGKTLQEIAGEFGLTRERVRQLIQKTVRLMPLMYEDYYSAPYEYFRLSREEFSTAFPEVGQIGFEYLGLRHRRGKQVLNSGTLDEYSGPFKEFLLKYLTDNEAQREIQTVTKSSIVYHVLLENQDRSLSLDEFEKAYNEYIFRKNYPANRLQINIRSLVNNLHKAEHIVFDANNCVRYCMADADTIWNTIQFSSYSDTVISAELLYRDYPELMEMQDIRDGYELFYVLKTSKERIPLAQKYNVIFRRVPIMIIGEGDEGHQAIRLLQAISPVTADDYYAAYESRYGVKKESAPGNPNITEPLSRYYIDGHYVIDVPAIDSRDVPRITYALSKKSLWFMDEIEHIFVTQCNYTSLRSLNAAAMRRIGYTLNSEYAYKSSYGTMTGYMNSEIFSKEIVDLNTLDPRLLRLTAFASLLSQKRQNGEYFDIAPRVLMSFAGLQKRYGITKDDISHLQHDALTLQSRKYFNAHSLQDILGHTLSFQKIKDNEYLGTSIIRSQESVYAMSVTGGYILTREGNTLRLNLVLEWFTSEFGKMGLTALVSRFNDYFATNFERYKIAEKLRTFGSWDNCVTDTYDSYIDEFVDDVDFEDDDFFKEEYL